MRSRGQVGAWGLAGTQVQEMALALSEGLAEHCGVSPRPGGGGRVLPWRGLAGGCLNGFLGEEGLQRG